MQTVSKSAVDMSELSSRSDDGVSVSEYYAEKLWSLSGAEVSRLAGLGRESTAELFGNGGSRPKIANEETAAEEILFGVKSQSCDEQFDACYFSKMIGM